VDEAASPPASIAPETPMALSADPSRLVGERIADPTASPIRDGVSQGARASSQTLISTFDAVRESDPAFAEDAAQLSPKAEPFAAQEADNVKEPRRVSVAASDLGRSAPEARVAEDRPSLEPESQPVAPRPEPSLAKPKTGLTPEELKPSANPLEPVDETAAGTENANPVTPPGAKPLSLAESPAIEPAPRLASLPITRSPGEANEIASKPKSAAPGPATPATTTPAPSLSEATLGRVEQPLPTDPDAALDGESERFMPSSAAQQASVPSTSPSASVQPSIVQAPIQTAVQTPAMTPSALPSTTATNDANLTTQIGNAIDQIAEAREAGRSARPELTVQHREFGAVSMRLDAVPGDLRATLSSRDPGFVPAVQAALVERAALTATETTAGQNSGQNSSSQRGSDQSGQAASQGGAQSGLNERYGSSPGSQQGSAQPYSRQEGDDNAAGLRRAADADVKSDDETGGEQGLYA
ncbi:MAG: hypothetical protein AAFR88_05740, partial [Pseudomonadota bacterium]